MPSAFTVRTIHLGDRGEDVRDIQRRLAAGHARIDPKELVGVFGASTESAVRAFQQERGLLVDGKVGPETWAHLVEAGYALGDRVLYLRAPMLRGDDVRALQRRVNRLGFDAGREDGIFGERCDRAVREFQRNVGMDADGVVGLETLAELERIPETRMDVSGAMVREAEALRRMSSSLRGTMVAVDAGHGPDDTGEVGPTGLSEDRAAYALAESVVAELARRGAKSWLLRGKDENPDPPERARRANEREAAVCLSVHLNGGRDPAAEGSMCLYYGTDSAFSHAGQLLAESIQDELTSRLGLTDGRTHPMAIAILRETRMPAVQIEPCFLTNPREERLLAEEAFRSDVAIAIAHGVERFLGARAGRADAVSNGRPSSVASTGGRAPS
jgi:N-acetylmuramoyl-L-alanine amidase